MGMEHSVFNAHVTEGIPVRTAQPALFQLTEVPLAKKTKLCRTFAAHRKQRLARRVHSLDVRVRLARMPVSRIAAHDLHSLAGGRITVRVERAKASGTRHVDIEPYPIIASPAQSFCFIGAFS
jgi:hypothetical protein